MPRKLLILLALLLIPLLTSGCNTKPKQKKISNTAFTQSFNADKKNLVPTGKNPFFILQPGYTQVLKGKDEGKDAVDEIKVLDETRIVDGVRTRIVKETHRQDSRIVEISFNFFAIDKTTNSVFYFGEDSQDIENGKVVGHEGSWLSGRKGAKFGLIMPGINLLGAKYMQEIAPGVAEDRAETVSVSEEIKTPAGTFDNALKTKETTPLEPDVVEFKFYAPSIGLIQDGNLKLVKYGFE